MNFWCRIRLHKWNYISPFWRECERCKIEQRFKFFHSKWMPYKSENDMIDLTPDAVKEAMAKWRKK